MFVHILSAYVRVIDISHSTDEPVIKHRSFDPETRTLKKRTNAHDEDVEMEEDTVEHRVEGLAEKIIAEDAERRAQDLVRVLSR